MSDPFDPKTSPGMTDLMVPPESIEDEPRLYRRYRVETLQGHTIEVDWDPRGLIIRENGDNVVRAGHDDLVATIELPEDPPRRRK